MLANLWPAQARQLHRLDSATVRNEIYLMERLPTAGKQDALARLDGVEAGIFHAFHVAWIGEIQKSLNGGLLPKGYYALAEQHAGQAIADVLTLHSGQPPLDPWTPPPDTGGGTAVAEAPPKVRRHQTIEANMLLKQRTVAIRHVSGHHLVALIEIVSPANKDRAQSIYGFVQKAASALYLGVHLLVVDVFPPTAHDSRGIHGAIWDSIQSTDQPYDLPLDEPMTLAAYVAGPQIEAYLEHLAVGAALPEMPLFLRRERYVGVPLEATYQAAFDGMPGFWPVLQRQPA